MQSKFIDERLSAGPQIKPGDIPKLAARGFRSIVCARPDGEAEDQPSFAAIAEAAHAAGIEARYAPVGLGPFDREQTSRFAAALRASPVPVFAYAQSGGRAVMLCSMCGRPWRMVSV